MMRLGINILLTIVRFVAIILHSVGIYFLISSNRHDRNYTQQLYIINLSVTEIWFNVLWLLMLPLSKLFTISDSVSAIIKDVQHYVMICIYTMVAFVFYATMIFITLDRLVAVKLALKYRIYWNTKRAKYLVLGTWLVGCLLFLCILVIYESTGIEFNTPIHLYLYTPINFAFIILATFTYVFIFRQYKKSVDMKRTSSRRNKTFVVFYKSRFYLPVIIILTFLLFVILPDLYLFILTPQSRKSETILSVCLVSYSISNISDGCLYIFLQSNIRNQLWKKCHCNRIICCYKVSSLTISKEISPRIPVVQGDYLMKYSTIFWIDNNSDITLSGPEKLVWVSKYME